MKSNKTRVSLILAVAVLIFSSLPVFAEDADQESDTTSGNGNFSEQETIIHSYFDNISSDDWDAWASTYTSSMSSTYRDFAQNSQNQASHTGILTVNNAQVKSITKVSNEVAPIYPELSDYYQNGDVETYKVILDLRVDAETEYFQNGVTEKLMILVNDGGQWSVGVQCSIPTEYTRGIGYGFVTGDTSSPPSTIKVSQGKNGTVYSKTFSDFLKNTVTGEIGSAGYKTEAVRAVVMSDKMFAWWCVLGKYRETSGCDIWGGFDVAWDVNRASSSYNKDVSTAVTYLNSNYVVASNGKFFAVGANNFTSNDYAGSGHVVQSGAQKLAESGKTWKDIMHYYLDNSAYNNPNVGIVKIG